MDIQVLPAHHGKSANITCPPEGEFQASLLQIKILAALRPENLLDSGRLKHHGQEAIALRVGIKTDRVRVYLQRLKNTY
jgi:hypothetical protein